MQTKHGGGHGMDEDEGAPDDLFAGSRLPLKHDVRGFR